MDQTSILTPKQIALKTSRMAVEICEQNSDSQKVILAGINKNGWNFARLLDQEIRTLNSIEPILCHLILSPADPLSKPIEIDIDPTLLGKYPVVIVDDVANTGRTIFYAFTPLLQMKTQKVQVAVLIDRMHKTYPIQVNYVGLSLATTLQNNILVTLPPDKEPAAILL